MDYPDSGLSPQSALPFWHNDLVVQPRSPVASSPGPVNGAVQADPEALRAAAEAAVGYPVSLDLYTLARYVASEVGSGSVEEQMAVAQVGINQARRRGVSITRLLLGTPGAQYGSINVGNPPQNIWNRWAATSAEATYQSMAVARMAMDGTAGDFVRGADDQDGPDYAPAWANLPGGAFGLPAYRAQTQHHYWAGPIAGVNPWTTYLQVFMPDVDPGSGEGQERIADAVNALQTPASEWAAQFAQMVVSAKPLGAYLLGTTGLLLLAGAGYVGWKILRR